MPLTPPLPDPGPQGERPLSDREKHDLADLEASLTADDPQLSARMAWVGPRLLRDVSPRVLNLTVQAGIVLIVALVALPTEMRAGLIVLLVMFAPVAFGMCATRDHGRSTPPATEDRPPS